ncbi:3'(2'),5'-bisphosphate nucleotidase CysQ [Arvimicrobium flavum]|uniref:3'(2'),5'-bisphosphate nucleotidase CysQ n=1 Tax=Arvimicrobium flavum TaxID=3393320 RepID=UPI00237A5826|nr:3'(2'),5'-bisphosphate nucleotidase CysQ [Mesorhizobium shangrilense]
MGGDLRLLEEAAREAGQIALRYFKRDPEVWMKGGRSPVSEADYAVDSYLRETLLAARPGYGWLSEETVDGEARLSARRTFVVDPIDGTRAFLNGRSTWCISVAVVEDGVSLCGVLDCPAKNNVFVAAKGRGSWLDGRPIKVRTPAQIPVIGGPKSIIDALPHGLRAKLPDVPYIPSLAYRLAMVAKGELDATFVKPNSHDWDLAAADVILREAGGRILNEAGKPPRYAGRQVTHGALVAGSGSLLDEIAGAIVEFES